MPSPESIERRTRQIRRGGYVFFGSILIWLLACLIASTLSMLTNDKENIKDPFSGAPIYDDIERCEQWGAHLLGRHERLEAAKGEGSSRREAWRTEVDGWTAYCARFAPDEAEKISAKRGPISSPR